MGDVHFIIRHGLTGFVFLLFVFFGLYISVNQVVTEDLLAKLNPGETQIDALGLLITLLTTAFLSTPVLGVFIQGIHTALMYATGSAFADPARKEIAKYIRHAVCSFDADDRTQVLSDRHKQRLAMIRDDLLFVWLYHTQAQPQMIDWARRRRSYNYLGWNWLIAASTGIMAGASAPWVFGLSKLCIVLIFTILSGAWAIGTMYVARQMIRDVDDMEFVWTMSKIYPAAFSRLSVAPADDLDSPDTPLS